MEGQFVPRDREAFFDAQRRNRRATWRLSALCALSAVVMGIPLALIVTPLLYAVVLIGADVINLFSPVPSAFWDLANNVARSGLVAFDWLLQHQPADPAALAIGGTVLLLPGAVLSLGLWLGINGLFRRAGVGGALLAFNAREPNPSDLNELRLADVVQEMAIASGLPAPPVFLVDASGANAAAIGTSPTDARIIVSRRLVDDLSREELEGVLAHVMASIGNGDLRIAFRVTAIFETCGLLVTLINSPFGGRSRRTLWRILRAGLGDSSQEGRAAEAAAVADLLARNVELASDDIDRLFETGDEKSAIRSIRNFLLFPIFFTNAAIKLSLWFFSSAVLGPSMALLWRTRRYLADASAVQLTRNPDGLASALQKLNDDAGVIPGGDWAAHLFVVSPSRSDHMASEGPSSAQKALLAQIWLASARSADGAATATQGGSVDVAAVAHEFAAVQRAAFAGDAQAIARLRGLAQAAAAADPALAGRIPDPADLIAARKGDMAAIARLRAFRRETSSRGVQSTGGSDTDEGKPSSMSSLLVGFHPPLKCRLKRLDRMGAHVELAAPDSKTWLVGVILGIVFAPLLLLIVAVFLLLIAIMTLASLVFLVVWLAFIHKVFALAAHQ